MSPAALETRASNRASRGGYRWGVHRHFCGGSPTRTVRPLLALARAMGCRRGSDGCSGWLYPPTVSKLSQKLNQTSRAGASRGRREPVEHVLATRHHLRGRPAFFRPFAFAEGAKPAMAKSSSFFPDLIAAVNHRGFNPRPAQVSVAFSGLRYLGATDDPFRPPRPDFVRAPPTWNRLIFESSDSRARR
jgi:hypothetical protein